MLYVKERFLGKRSGSMAQQLWRIWDNNRSLEAAPQHVLPVTSRLARCGGLYVNVDVCLQSVDIIAIFQESPGELAFVPMVGALVPVDCASY